MHGILGSVADLGVRQRPLQPVGAGFALGQLDRQHFLDQARIAHGEAQVQVTGRQLRVEQRLRQLAGQAQQHFQVLAAGMQDLDHAIVVEQLGQRLPVIDQQRVDEESALAVADLYQPGFRVKGVDPHEFGVHCHERQLAPLPAALGQGLVVTDPVYFDGHEALPLTLARSIYGAGTVGETWRPPRLHGLREGWIQRLAASQGRQLANMSSDCW